MSEKKPVIVVKKSHPKVSEPDAVAPKIRTDSMETEENSGRKPLNRQARRNRDKVAHFARTFPALWPDADKGIFRPMKVGIKEQVKAYIEANPGCGMTFGQWIVVVRLVTSLIQYQRCVREGEIRYDIYGEPAGVVTAQEAAYARLRASRIRARLDAREEQNRVAVK